MVALLGVSLIGWRFWFAYANNRAPIIAARGAVARCHDALLAGSRPPCSRSFKVSPRPKTRETESLPRHEFAACPAGNWKPSHDLRSTPIDRRYAATGVDLVLAVAHRRAVDAQRECGPGLVSMSLALVLTPARRLADDRNTRRASRLLRLGGTSQHGMWCCDYSNGGSQTVTVIVTLIDSASLLFPCMEVTCMNAYRCPLVRTQTSCPALTSSGFSVYPVAEAQV